MLFRSYNSFRVDGIVVDARRALSLVAVDLAADLPRGVSVRGEAAIASVELPPSLGELLGTRQWGVHVDVVVPVLRLARGVFAGGVLNVTARAEHVDFNVGRFSSTGGLIGDDRSAITTGLSFRPTGGSAFKLQYRREWAHDLVRNAATRSAVVQAGIATYF